MHSRRLSTFEWQSALGVLLVAAFLAWWNLR